MEKLNTASLMMVLVGIVGPSICVLHADSSQNTFRSVTVLATACHDCSKLVAAREVE
jgi:hypothetical protein